MGVKETDTGLAPPNLWDLPADKQRHGSEHPLQVARCTKIIKCGPLTEAQQAAAAARAAGGSDLPPNADEQDKYVITVRHIAKFVVALGDKVSPTDIEEGMRVGFVELTSSMKLSHVFGRVTREKYQIQIPLPPKIDPSVTAMQVEEKPDVTYSDVGGCKDQIEKLREVVETPLLNVRRCLHPTFKSDIATVSHSPRNSSS
jgi:26S proteasome regulatory subunit T1